MAMVSELAIKIQILQGNSRQLRLVLVVLVSELRQKHQINHRHPLLSDVDKNHKDVSRHRKGVPNQNKRLRLSVITNNLLRHRRQQVGLVSMI